jgi:kynurenine formamidase
MTRIAVAGLVLLVTACAAPAAPPPGAPPFPSGELVDLSHAYDAQTIFWPTSEPFRLETVSDGPTPEGYYYASNNFSGAEHGGTHIDAPRHFAEGHPTVDQIPLSRLVGAAVVIDVTRQSEADADYQIGVQDLTAWETDHGPIPDGAIVLLRTGFSTRWPDAVAYLGTDLRGDEGVANLHFPGLHPDAARWLVANRRIGAIGIDTASIDYGRSSLYESHRALFAADIPAFENLTALERLPATGAFIAALPMKIGGGSGGPLRAVAIVPPGGAAD